MSVRARAPAGVGGDRGAVPVATFFRPLVAVIPSEAAVPALVLVGFLMMQQVKGISWDDLEIAIPAFLTIVLMPFTYSITVGIGAGFLTYVLIKIVRGKAAPSTRCVGDQRPVRRLLRAPPSAAIADADAPRSTADAEEVRSTE